MFNKTLIGVVGVCSSTVKQIGTFPKVLPFSRVLEHCWSWRKGGKKGIVKENIVSNFLLNIAEKIRVNTLN